MKGLLILLSLILVLNRGISQPTHYYVKTYNFGSDGYGGGIAELNDGGFINSGAKIDTVEMIFNGDTIDVLAEVITLCRIKTDGKVKWGKNYLLNSNCAYGGSFTMTKDSMIVLVSVGVDSALAATGSFNPDYLLMKTDLNGNIILSANYQTPGNDYAMGIKELSDGKLILLGFTDGYASLPTKGDFNLVKVEPNGTFIASKVYFSDTLSYDFPVSLFTDENDDIFSVGNSFLNSSTQTDYLIQLVRTDRDLNLKRLVKMKLMGSPGQNNSFNVSGAGFTAENEISMVGTLSQYDTVPPYNYKTYSFLILTDKEGQKIGAYKYGLKENNSTLNFNAVAPSSNGDIHVAFNTYDSLGNTQNGIITLLKSGVIKAIHLFPGSLYPSKIKEIAHHGLVSGGLEFSSGKNFIAKLDSNTHVPCIGYNIPISSYPFDFSVTAGGQSGNLGKQIKSPVKVNQTLVNDSLICMKTVTILPPPRPTEYPCDPNAIFLPNTFTPNGDGNNDVFRPRGLSLRASMKFSVYNRWGEQVFSTTDPTNAWDGTYRDRHADPGVFGWILQIKCEDGSEFIRKGNITLLR